MSERAKVTAKTSETKKENSASQRRKTNFSKSTNSPVDHILFLQRTVGNQAVEKLLKSGVIQAKLTTGTIHLNIPYGLHSAFCTPAGTDVKGVQDFALKTVGATPSAGSFGAGFTSPTVSYSPTELEVTTSKTKKGITCKPKAVTPTLTTESRYVSSGTHRVPDLEVEVPSEVCGKKGKPLNLPVHANISEEVSKLAKQAEEEHCDDFGYAFNLTVGNWGSEVNKRAKSDKTYGPKDTVDECKKLIEMDLTKTLEESLKDFASLAPKTDTRDKKGYHSFELDLMSVDDKCSRAIFDVIKSSTNKIGTISPKDIMK